MTGQGGVREIALGAGFYAIVDAENYEWLSRWEWSRNVGTTGVYAARACRQRADQWSVAYMHRAVAGASGDEITDHINGDTLDNRRANLRVCTRFENAQNRVSSPGVSGFRGVYASGGKWVAEIVAHGVKHRRWGFARAEEAARCRDEMAKRLHREFAVLNFPGSR
jgi:hypothetical protein